MKVRDLSVGPGNFVTPTYLAETVKRTGVVFAVTQPESVNIDELRLSHS